MAVGGCHQSPPPNGMVAIFGGGAAGAGGAPARSWALLGAPGHPWASLGAPRRFWCAPGCSWCATVSLTFVFIAFPLVLQ